MPEVKLFVVVQTICGRHGNDVIHTLTKFNLHAYYSEQVGGVKKYYKEEKLLRLFASVYEHVVIMETCSCHGHVVIRMCTKFDVNAW